ncbi:GumC family protein [Salinarimonas soli]|nr:polysaccharide biosynthesis tyrosine autokinase [Salinarimonas soli]
MNVLPPLPTRRTPMPQAEGAFDIDLVSLIAMLRRRWRWWGAAMVLCIGAGIFYIATTKPVYTASASLLIDTRRPTLFQQGAASTPDPITDVALVESQLETLKSRRIADAVVRKLQLNLDEEYGAGKPSSFGLLRRSIVSMLGLGGSETEGESGSETDPAVRDAIDGVMKSTSVRRAGSSYVMEIEARSSSPEKAARIANEVVNAYIADQLAFRSEILQREVTWLESRIDSLRDRADVADRRVQEFKVDNNIVDANGRLLVDQQLADVSTQLAAARADTAQTKARLDRVQQIAQSRQVDEGVSEALRNEVITKLRQQLNEVSRREAEWTSRYGPTHPAAVNLRTEMASLQRSIQEEVTRIAETYRSEYEIARAREASLERSLADQFKNTSLVRQAQVRLRGYESTAETYRALYDSFLQKYLQTLNQQTSPVTEARIITTATPPSGKSWPKSTIILLGASSAGMLLGFSLAMGREMLDRRIRTTGQVEQITNVRCVGSLPITATRGRTGRRLLPPPDKAVPGDGLVFELPADGAASFAVRHPYSQFAEVIRALKVAVDLGHSGGPKVIGVVSTFPNEGKSTVAANFAGLLAHAGAQVLLIDGDLRNSDLTRTLVPNAEHGLLDVAHGERSLPDVLWVDKVTGLHFLPGSPTRRSPHTSESLAGEGMERVMTAAQSVFDYVIMDLSPFGLIVDAQVVSRFVSDFILVTEWGKTSASAVSKALANAPEIQDKLAAAVLNKVNVAQFGSYDVDASQYHSSRYWSKYVDA